MRSTIIILSLLLTSCTFFPVEPAKSANDAKREKCEGDQCQSEETSSGN